MVKDTLLYDLLEIKPTATESDIRRAYLRMAKKLHPDRNRDDPNAEQKFNQMKEAYEILSDPVKRETYDANGYEFLKMMEDPMSALTSPAGLSKLLSSVSPVKRYFIIILLSVVFFSSVYFFITLGLRIDSSITWNWSIIFIPLYIVEVILCIYFISDFFLSFKRCCKSKKHRTDIEQELNYYDEDSGPNSSRPNDSLDADPPIINILTSLNSIIMMITSITMAYSLDTKQIYLTSSLIPYFIYIILDIFITFIKACYRLVSCGEAFLNLTSIIIPLTILFCSLRYDELLDWSYVHAFIPIWIYYAYALLRDIYYMMVCNRCFQRNMPEFEEFKRSACSTIFFDIISFIIVLFILLKIIGYNIYVFWVFFPFLLIFVCFGFFSVCSIVIVLRNPKILEQASTVEPSTAPSENQSPVPEVNALPPSDDPNNIEMKQENQPTSAIDDVE